MSKKLRGIHKAHLAGKEEGGGGGYSFRVSLALSHWAINYASLSRRSDRGGSATDCEEVRQQPPSIKCLLYNQQALKGIGRQETTFDWVRLY